jgi:hypothetical protein
MKTNYLLILVMGLSNLLSAQTNHAYEFFKYRENSDYIKKMRNVIETPFNNINYKNITVNDSIYTYVGKTTNTNWNLSYRQKTLNFNQNGKMTNAISYFYNKDNGTWENKKDTFYVKYYDSGIKQESIKKSWNTELQQWSDTCLSYKYNENGNLTEVLYRKWLYGTSGNFFSWGFKEVYNLNEEGNIDTYLYYYWSNTGVWVLEYKITYFYKNGLVEKKLNEKLDDNQHWNNFAQMLYSYDENNIMTEMIYQEWSDYDQEWRNYKKILYTFDNNNLSNELLYYWNIDNNNWDAFLKTLYTYNDNNDITEKLYKTFSNQQLVNFEIKQYTYNDDNNLTLYTYKEWNSYNSVWNKVTKNEYFWSQISKINTIYNNNIKVFPNPVNDILYFENCKDAVIYIYDTKGSLINKQYMQNNSINVSDLNKGCYIMKIIKANNIVTSKFIKN